MTREPVTCRPVRLANGGTALVRGRGPLTDHDRAAVQEFADLLLARQRVVHLRPGRPQRIRTLGKLWAWGALGLPCRHPDGPRRCGTCPCCYARDEALRTWCP